MSDKAEQKTASGSLDTVKWLIVAALVVAIIVGNGYYSDVSVLVRAVVIAAAGIVAALIALQTERGHSFNQLRKDSWLELRRITWPTRQETLQTTLIVLVFVAFVGLILFVMDWMLNGAVSWIIG